MNTSALPERRRWNLWPISIISFFTIAIIGCGAFITFCSRHPADLISANYYEEEVRYQGQIDRQQHALGRGQLASVSYEPASRQITVSVPVNSVRTKPSGKIQLYRPSAMDLDRELKLQLSSDGTQAIDAGTLLPGLWKVRVTWTVDQRDYFIDQRIVIPSKT
jgi:hypothetical protein